MSKSLSNNSIQTANKSDSRFHALFNAAVDGIIIIDNQGIVQDINEAAQSLFGYEARDIKNQNISTLMPNPDRENHDEYLRRYIETGKAKIIGIGRHVKGLKKDGSVFPMKLSVGEYYETDQRYFVGIIHDLTKQIETESMAKDLRDRLAHVDRISTMGEMASGIAHEVNQPLSAIGSYVQACRRRLNNNPLDVEKLNQLLHKVEEQTIRAGKVIERVRSLVRPQREARSSAIIDDVIVEALDLAQSDARNKGVSITTHLNTQAIKIEVDRIQIQQVVINLIRNAIDAIEESDPGNREIDVTSYKSLESGFIEIQIRDRADGISEHVKAKLFHPFVSSKKLGTGLGLSISKSIIDAHGGELWCRSERPGTSFIFSLPISSTDAA